MLRKLVSALAGAALILAPLPALADGAPTAQSIAPAAVAANSGPVAATGPLAPAGAAGVKPAQAFTEIPWVFVTGLTIVAIAVGLALGKSSTATTTTTDTDTTTQ